MNKPNPSSDTLQGEGVPTQGGYRGVSLKLAARLCALAKPGEILAPVGFAHLAHSVWVDSALSLCGRRG